MALDNYTDLQTAVANELARSDLNSFIPDWITLAESRINSLLRVRQMETTTASTMVSGLLPVPSNYIELKNAYLISVTPYQGLDRKTSNWIYEAYPYRQADREPDFIAREGSNFIFGPFPDTNYTVQLQYYNRLAPLSTGTNSVFTAYPGLWFFGALCESAHRLKADSRIAMWEQRFGQLIKMVQDESDSEDVSGTVLEMAPIRPKP